jgi:hypothetical protein
MQRRGASGQSVKEKRANKPRARKAPAAHQQRPKTRRHDGETKPDCVS